VTPERWQKLEKLFYAALELEGDARAAYLREACGDDHQLRHELTSLLTWDARPEQLFGPRALQAFANVLSPGRLIGQQLGIYKITALIGAGAMGDVYQAHDTQLGREVAIKVLPPSLIDNPSRLARFEREARMLAAIKHRNIAVIHGLEQVGNTHFLVMELVQGVTLADRISSEGALPVKEVLDIAQQLAEGLETAHEKRIIHRDLKPANINLTPEGEVKVLDFGLAKPADDNTTATRPAVFTSSPKATQPGAVVGTPAYMSPEQAAGKMVDTRTDIWSFGCVVYELLTATPAFSGETSTDTIAALFERDPDWSALPRATPARLRELLQRCLRKEPRARLRDIGDARLEIEQIRSDSSLTNLAPLITGARGETVRAWLGWAVAALAVAAALVLAYRGRQPEPSPPTVRSEILPPDGTNFGSIALSPDGRQLAFVALKNGKKQLWVRALATAVERALPTTEGATFPFWSADSLHIGFFADSKLKRIPLAGGSARIVADAPNARGGAWSDADVIVFAPGSNTPLYSVAAAGGPSTPLTRLEAADREISHRWPSFLPGGKQLLYFSESAQPGYTGSGVTATIFVGSLDGSVRKRLLADGYGARYLSQGYLAFARGTELVAQRFRPQTLSLDADIHTLANDLDTGRAVDGPPFSTSESGDVVVYRSRGQSSSQQRALQWFGRDGTQLAAVGTPDRFWSTRLSPDNRFVAAEVEDAETRTTNIWLYELATSRRTRFTFGQIYTSAVWAPDGASIVVATRGARQHFSLFRRASNGSSAEEPLIQAQGNIYAEDWSRDGRYLLYTLVDAAEKPGASIWVLPMQGERTARRLFQSAADDRYPHFSPNGRWVAYRSNESGHNEIYVTHFGETGGKWLVSSGGGDLPVWRKDGQELYFLSQDNELMAVSVRSDGPTFTFNPPKVLFNMNVLGGYGERFAASADGQQFLALVNKDEAPRPLNAVIHWSAASK
jgi:Tol biopolymer transport system component/tRNA A-37 threonylcarbamoyl transferase component Bud32